MYSAQDRAWCSVILGCVVFIISVISFRIELSKFSLDGDKGSAELRLWSRCYFMTVPPSTGHLLPPGTTTGLDF